MNYKIFALFAPSCKRGKVIKGFALFAPSGKSGKSMNIKGFALFAPSGKSGKSMNHEICAFCIKWQKWKKYES